ncbi:MAG: DUF1232 domain-containing protein [Chitinophagales bacterium]|nr:DUF1232 domain-containing protein [Chitinophagales bacterium]
MVKIITSYICKHIKTMGIQLIYSAFLMIFAYKSPHTPKWAKRIILGAFAYLLSPIDTIPDLTPVLGFTDDLSVITFGLVTIACYIDQEIRQMARAKLAAIFSNVDETALATVDAKL